MTKVEFRPNLKQVNVTGGKAKLTLEIDKEKIAGSLGALAMLEGGKITASFRPETIPYNIPYDRTTNAPTLRYDENKDGIWEEIKEEQLNMLDINEIENREFMVEIDIVDEFIKSSELDYQGGIDPNDVLEKLEHGESYADIAVEYEMTGDELEDEINRAREHYAPFASAWDEKRNREE